MKNPVFKIIVLLLFLHFIEPLCIPITFVEFFKKIGLAEEPFAVLAECLNYIYYVYRFL